MQARRFGRTGHMSTIAIFGAAAFWKIEQEQADRVMEMVIEHGVNHIDVAPSYGQAELRLGPWLEKERKRFFLGCKTMERSMEGVRTEMSRSLELLHTDAFDLYQIHAITSMDELDAATRPGGALEAILEARSQGRTRYIGITGHGADSPAIFLEALRRFDFDSVLFPLNFVQYANPAFRTNAEELLRICRDRDVGVMIIKSITRSPWGEHTRQYNTWYRPFDDYASIQAAVNFALSQDVTGICTAGDTQLLPLVLRACDQYNPLDSAVQEALIASASEYEPLFP